MNCKYIFYDIKKIQHVKSLDAWSYFGESLTHSGRMCVSKLNVISSDNGLSPGRRQAIIWTSAGILLIGLLATNFSEILSKIHTFSFKKMHLNMSSVKWRPFCLGLNVLKGVARSGKNCPKNVIPEIQWQKTYHVANMISADMRKEKSGEKEYNVIGFISVC